MNNRQITVALHTVFWLLIEVIFVWIFSIAINFREALIAVSINILLLIALFYIHTEGVNRFLEKKKIVIFFTFSFTCFIFITLIRIYLTNLIIGNYIPSDSSFFYKPFQRLVFFEFFTSFIIAVLAILYQLLRNRYQREQQNLALINEQQAAQLQFLKAQINPHFLFNALNNVYSLTIAKSDDAPKMLLKLSDLLRYVIYDGQQNAVLLEKEMANISKFIDLFQMKSEHPLPISLEIEGNMIGKTIEPMILIPLLENCFKHCDFEINEAAFTSIKLIVSEKTLLFFTQNTFNKKDEQKDKIGGVGLQNIQHRLSLRYPDKHEFKYDIKGNVFEVSLKIQF